MKRIAILSVLAATAALSACQSGREIRQVQQPIRMAPTVDGTWADPNGIISTFSAGTFTTRTTDTNQLLASGNYVNVSPTLVEINMTSMVRNTQSKVNCAMVGVTQLNCTTDSGAQFSLSRRG
ncbi:outer membrane lipoprotein Omp10 [Pararhizobium antarcticum]|uniref:Outer membrane lipoprotein n=1 Tax=Pararhizobium antarcticum TaxID=1798805 RepID=A0A657LQP6_9HYPH|nr:outer membrane lipoprotein Omp10 [Pararhizobium antarcticum]OJF94513.1 hypothetical protein AX760_19880 [Pararhizobium antarcticum]OJF96653.1 hypothetical protein AX761_03560 [Rhizobium sp. 58]